MFHILLLIEWYAFLIYFLWTKKKGSGIFRSKALDGSFSLSFLFSCRFYKILQTITFIIVLFFISNKVNFLYY